MTRDPERQNPDWADGLVMVGEIVKPHGIRGEVKVYSYSGEPENFKNYKHVVLQGPAGKRGASYRVLKSRAQGKLAILQLEGVASREAAEALQGSTLWVRKADFPQLGADEYYWHQLIGLQVCTESGRELGEVSSLFSTGAHDVLVVNGRGREYLIPVSTEIINTVDEQQGRLTITPPPGLLEANEED
jgi:16S rRNA processing protein RimM